MNDPQIRNAFHRNFLEEEHLESNTLVVDELGIKHGKSRADIAVINGNLTGYEIKSDNDSLIRLENQINFYNSIFDNISIIVGKRHLKSVIQILPDWWGVILATLDTQNELQFKIIRPYFINETVNDYAVASLLWRNEAQEILSSIGLPGSQLREKRSILYTYLVENFSSQKLRYVVREHLKQRTNWRGH